MQNHLLYDTQVKAVNNYEFLQHQEMMMMMMMMMMMIVIIMIMIIMIKLNEANRKCYRTKIQRKMIKSKIN